AWAPVLHMGSTAGAPWWDMWDPKIVDRMDQVAREQILPLRDDPRLIGYYSDKPARVCHAPLVTRSDNLNQPLRSSIGTANEDSSNQCPSFPWLTSISVGTPRPSIWGFMRRTWWRTFSTKTKSCA